jgi:hypothetical protein
MDSYLVYVKQRSSSLTEEMKPFEKGSPRIYEGEA